MKIEKLRPFLRILQTEILKTDGGDFECDRFWPETMEGRDSPWKEVETKSVHSWTGIDTPQGTLKPWAVDEKVGVKVRVRGWEYKQG